MAGQQDIGALVVTLEAQTAAFNAGMAQATKSLNSFGAASTAIESQFAGVQGAFVKFNNATAALSNGMAIVSQAFGKLRSFTSMREQLEVIQSSFEAVLGSAERAADMMMRVRKISNELGSDLPSTASAIRRMAIGLNQLGSSNAEIDRITTTFLKLGAIGGSIEEATAAIFQFSQALGSGTLRGDELISLLERQPLIAMEVAKYLQKIGLSADGSIGSLRKLASDGKVTSIILRDALLDAEKAIAEKYAKMPLKISQVLNQISNLFTGFAIDINKTFEINETTVNLLVGLRNAVRDIVVPAGDFLAFLKEAGLLSYALATALGVLTIAFRSFIATALLAAIPAVIAFSSAFAAAVVALKVPLAVIATVVTALATLANQLGITATSFDKFFLRIVENAPLIAKAFKKETETVAQYIGRLNASIEEAETDRALAAMGASRSLSGDFKEKIKPLTEFEKQSKEMLESFRKGLVTAQIESSLLTIKIKELEKAIANTKDKRLAAQWTEQLKQLKESLDPADTALRKFAESIQNTTNPANAAAKELSELDKALAAGYISWETYGIAVEEAMSKLGGTTMKETKDAIDEIGVAIGSSLSSGVGQLTDAIYDADSSFQEFASNFLISIAKMITQLLILSALKSSLKGTSIGSFFGFADGGTFRSGTGLEEGVYDSPTVFKFAQGGTFGTRTGVLGEAGPEAILPLRRNSSGALGVMAESASTTVNVYNNNSSATEVSTRESTNADGSKQIDIMIEQKVRDMFARGSMDKTMRGVYGLSRTPA
jgi:tape measure domain-containing protein